MATAPNLTAVADYISLGLAGQEHWERWFPTGEEIDAASARRVPNCAGVTLPDTFTFGHDPFSMKNHQTSFSARTTWLLTKSFSLHSETILQRVGFSPSAAKLLTYYRICLLSAGCGAHKEQWDGIDEVLTQGSYGISLDCPALDTRAYEIAANSWPLLILTLISAFIDSGGKFKRESVAYCETMWTKTPWPKVLEEYDLSWSQVIRYLAQSFSPRALTAAITHRVAIGMFYTAPIYDVVPHTVDACCAVAMISPWGPDAAGIWWKVVTSYGTHLLTGRKQALRLILAETANDMIIGPVKGWIESNAAAYLDLLRILSPIILTTMRPMYMPAISSQLYLEHSSDDVKLVTHAKAFAEVTITQGFDQAALERANFDFTKLADVSYEALHPQRALETVDPNCKELMSTKFSLPSLKPWQSPSAHAVAIPTANSIGLSDEAEEELALSVGSVVLGKKHTSTEITKEPSGKPEYVYMVDRCITSSATTVSEEGLRLAYGALFSEKYKDTVFRKAMIAPITDKMFNRFWRPELTAARTIYDQYTSK